MSKGAGAMEKDKFSKEYQNMIEEAEQKNLKHITAGGPSRVHYWPMPKRRADFRELKRQLRERLLEKGQPQSPEYGWTKLKLEEVEDALRGKDTRRVLRLIIVGLVVAIAGVVATVVFGVGLGTCKL